MKQNQNIEEAHAGKHMHLYEEKKNKKEKEWKHAYFTNKIL